MPKRVCVVYGSAVIVDPEDTEVELMNISFVRQEEGDVYEVILTPGKDVANLEFTITTSGENSECAKWNNATQVVLAFGGR